MSALGGLLTHPMLGGILLPQSTLNTRWFAVFAAFVGINTVVYMGLTFSKLLPWPEPLHPTTIRRIFRVKEQEGVVEPIRPSVGRVTPAEAGVQDIARAFGWLGIVMVIRGTLLVLDSILAWSDFAAIFIGLAFIAIAQVFARTRIRPAAASWLWGMCIAGVAVMGTVRASEGATERVGFVLVLAVVLGAVSLTWPSFIVPEAILTGSFVYLAIQTSNALDPNWLVSFGGAVLASALLLVLRRRSFRLLEDVDRLENQLGTTDVLTGALTRQGLMTLGPYVMRGARRQEQPVFALVIDIDDLGAANRDYGDAYGDDVLRGVAEAIHSATRDADLLSRWNDDDFVVFGIGGDQSIEALTRRIDQNVDRLTVATGKTALKVSIAGVVGTPEEHLDGLVAEAMTGLPALQGAAGQVS